ncbi:MAG TPA: transporter substrate-binding domain-containing protein [Oligoflexus sp.]|uniref:substrate-binding periplasmic protein n=1 Tax=Oligoflexus sp. TaxID=1971216 RepID=UPI002D80B596|nr:transporter substrate-binding domain-containing protein [Oligoflexus sp.]HET9239933.1 transporter substrate-binding domain-containing protein [Oligoflexus sp.]
MRILLLFLLLLPDFAQSASFKVGVEYLDYYPAYNYIGKPSDASASKDILDDFAKKHGHTFEYVPLPVNRLYEKFLDGTLDFKFPDHKFWQTDLKRKHKVIYSDPVFEFIDGVLVRDPKAVKGLADLKKVGSFRGFTIFDYKAEIEAGKIEAKYFDSFRELIIATLKGSVDGAYLNIKVADYNLEQIKKEHPELGTLVFQESLPFTRSAYHLSTLRHEKLMNQFNQYLKEHRTFINKVIAERRVGI